MNEWNDVSFTKEEDNQLEESSKINEAIGIVDVDIANNVLVKKMKEYEIDFNDSEVCRIIDALNQIPN